MTNRDTTVSVQAPSKKRAWIIAIIAVVLAIAALAGTKVWQIKTMIAAGKTQKMPPESVTTAKVDKTSWLATREAVGTLVAVRAVTVSTEVPGQVKQLNFDSGADVRRGDVLVKLDTSTEDAQLASAEADLKLARINARRAETLRKTSANTPSELDAAESRLAQTEAQVALLK